MMKSPDISRRLKQYLNNLLLWCSFVSIIGSLTACSNFSHWRESYLKKAVEEATQDDIVTKLGEPWRKRDSLLNGESTWIYRYTLTKSELDPMGVNTLGKGVSKAANNAASIIGKGNQTLTLDKPQCIHYVLTFSPSKVLKNWIRESCSSTSL